VDDRSAPVVKFMHLQAFGGRPPIVENRSATNTLVVEGCDLKILGTGRGDIFVTDCPSGVELRSPGQRLWARQLNPEGDSDTGLVRNHGGRLWALGVKHEGRGVRFLADHGGQTEMLGLFNYAPSIATNDLRPAFDIRDAAFSAAGIREISFGNPYPVKVREQRGDDVRLEQGGGWIGWPLYRGEVKTTPSETPTPSPANPAAARPHCLGSKSATTTGSWSPPTASPCSGWATPRGNFSTDSTMLKRSCTCASAPPKASTSSRPSRSEGAR
jgi:hypothetical protein